MLEHDYIVTIKLNYKNTATIDTLIETLNEFINLFIVHSIDFNVISQLFKQIFKVINVTTFNTLISRVDFCNLSKGITLKYNISLLENWSIDNNLQNSFKSLEKLTQACELLTTRKSDWDIDKLSSISSKLNLSQIEHFLVMYKPVEYYEREIKRTFIDKILKYIKTNRSKMNEISKESETLTLELEKEIFIEIEFNPSGISLEEIDIPEKLGLNFLIKL